MTMYAYHKDGSENFVPRGHLIEVEDQDSAGTSFHANDGHLFLLGRGECAHLGCQGSWILVDLPEEMT